MAATLQREPRDPDRFRLQPDRLRLRRELARPGGNLTGLLQYEASITAADAETS
jgi:hypothetical protein